MKNIFISILILFIFTISLFAQEEPISFRNSALGGVINDNLDLIYDPIELRFVDSLRIYTNLSNLTSTQEQIFNNYSDNELLIGLSRPNPLLNNLWTAALIRLQNFEYANPVTINPDLTGWWTINGYGTLVDEYTEYRDLGTDGLYDLKRSVSQKVSNTRNVDSYSFIINNTYLLDKISLGLKLSLGNRATEATTASVSLGTGKYDMLGSSYYDPSFRRSVEEFYIDSNYSRLKWSENGNFLTEAETPSFKTHASFMVPVSMVEVRGDLQFYTINDQFKIRDVYDASHERFNPNISNYKRVYTEGDDYSRDEKLDGSGFGIGASVKHVFDKKLSRINDGFWHFGISYGLESFDYNKSETGKFISNEKVFDGTTGPLTDFEEKLNDNYSYSDIGDGSKNAININGKINVPLMDDVFFGCGGYYYISWLNRETKMKYDYIGVRDYSLTDNVSNINDYIRTEKQSGDADHKYELRTNIITIPVGIEYLFTENRRWALRFGSIFQYYSQVEKDAVQITNFKPYITKTEFGDGSVDISYGDNQYNSTSRNTSDAQSQTFFTYGLGFKATENLQIDLLGFFDVQNNVTLLEYIKYLRISLALKI